MKKLWCGTISVMLVVVMLINMLPLKALAIDNNSTIEVGEEPIMQETIPVIDSTDIEQIYEEQPAYVVEEDVSKRSEFYKEFILSNGLRLATIYPDSVHYEENGQWKEIDNTLTAKIVDGQSVYTNTSGLWDVRFPQRLNASNSISITKDGFTVSFGMAGEMRSSGDIVVASMGNGLETNASTILPIIGGTIDSIAQVQPIDTTVAKAEAEYAEIIPDKLHSRLLYPSVYNNTNIVYDLQSNQVKESIILQSFDSELMGYRYTLNTGGLIPVLNDDQSINLCDPNSNDIVMTMPAPFMLDANDEYCEDITVSLVQSSNSYILSYHLPVRWLGAEDRAWPVVLDPVVAAENFRSNIQDITVAENGTESNNEVTIKCGYGPTKGVMRVYLRYKELPALCSADVIVNATITLRKPYNSTLSAPIQVHKVNAPWEASQLNWSNKPAFTSSVEDVVVVQDPLRYTWDITDIAFGWYADTTNSLQNNTGMMFKASDDIESAAQNNWQQFCSSDNTTFTDTLTPTIAETRPILTIKYYTPNGLEDYWDYTTSSAGRAGNGNVQNYSGNLVWVHNDIGFDGNRMPVSISHIYNAHDAWNSETDTGNNKFGMGNGWKTNYNQYITQANGIYAWEDGDGTKHEFIGMSSTTYMDGDDLGLTLTVSGSGYTLSDKQGNKSVFDTNGRLTNQIVTHSNDVVSSITISYQSSTSNRISQITDGVGRKYTFTYNSNGLLISITYYGSNNTAPIMAVDFGYTNSNLTSVTYDDGATSTFSYTTKNLLSTATDVDGYTISFSYNTLAYNKPSRVTSVTESDNNQTGGQTIITYAYNRTVITDQDQNTLTSVFNEWGNTISTQDSEGTTTFYQYATDVNSFATKHRLLKASKPQGTAINLLKNTSFEEGTDWTLNSNSSITSNISENYSFQGKNSMCINLKNGAATVGATKGTFNAAPGESFSFSAYLKVNSGTVAIRIIDDEWGYAESDHLDANSNWTRIETTYTNTSTSTRTITLDIFLISVGTVYVDCVQLEKNDNASRYNLINDSDLGIISDDWYCYGESTKKPYGSAGMHAPGLVANRIRISGDPTSVQYVSQDIPISGNAGDRYVFTGWFSGSALPDYTNERFCGLKLVFNGTVSTTVALSIEPHLVSQLDWQYVAGDAIAPNAYSSLTLIAEYSYNANAMYIDGLQLFKEEFGEEYTYTNGNITTARDSLGQETTYVYDVRNDLIEIIPPADPTTDPTKGPIMKTMNTYDSFHKLTQSEKGYALYNEESEAWEWFPLETDSYEYDIYGNVTKHTSTANGVTKTTSATYTSNGNFLSTATDASGNTTRYGYHLNKSILEWIQYPKDTTATRTKYTYDEMFRLVNASTTTDKGNAMSATYAYDGDMLEQIQTPKTTYNFEYRAFGLQKSISVGNTALATYVYSHVGDTDNRVDPDKLLKRLDYGNQDSIKYYYDDLGRVTKEVYYEDNTETIIRTVTYSYNNSGMLATTVDSKTGYTTKYYYDNVGRSTGWRETTGYYTHNLRYAYDDQGRLDQVSETYRTNSQTIGTGERIVASYEYNDLRNLLETISFDNGVKETYEYDDFDRIIRKTTQNNNSSVLTENITYDSANDRITQLSIGNHGTYQYVYDANGNIIKITYGGQSIRYTYDSQNQLIWEYNPFAELAWMWTYDEAGNILSRTEYVYANGALGTCKGSTQYGYTNQWGDLLTNYNGEDISYDTIGNPLSDGTWSYTWEQGRQLARMSKSDANWTFHYDSNGMRYQRYSGGDVYTYVYNGSQLSRMTYRSNTMWFTYGADGKPLSINYNGTTYYYVTNLQGDVVGIVDSTGSLKVSYLYDAWGRLLSTEGDLRYSLGYDNPLRYRSYVYDRETGLYYLQSRYYNPEWGRFINADDPGYMGIDGTLSSYNLFAYCGNNPVMGYDPTGAWNWGVFAKVALTVAVVGLCLTGVGFVAAAAATVATTSVTVAVTTAVATAGITTVLGAVDGAICAEQSGGNWYDGAMAGAMGNAIGSLVSSPSLFLSGPDYSLRLNTAGRAASSLAYDFTYEYFSTGKVEPRNSAAYAADIMMDATLSPMYYYYTGGIANEYVKATINGLFDAAVDLFQTYVY